MSELVGICFLCFLSSGTWAQEVPRLERLDVKYPVFYSTSLMALGLPILKAGGAYKSGPSFNNFERAFTSAPKWENDSVVFNYVFHPL